MGSYGYPAKSFVLSSREAHLCTFALPARAPETDRLVASPSAFLAEFAPVLLNDMWRLTIPLAGGG